ncbi:hypothetical protein OAT84_00105 [Gammaproteobacteria bacterium]|nr:hypothetical protein [Gammaproteobacteria bacterium]
MAKEIGKANPTSDKLQSFGKIEKASMGLRTGVVYRKKGTSQQVMIQLCKEFNHYASDLELEPIKKSTWTSIKSKLENRLDEMQAKLAQQQDPYYESIDNNKIQNWLDMARLRIALRQADKKTGWRPRKKLKSKDKDVVKLSKSKTGYSLSQSSLKEYDIRMERAYIANNTQIVNGKPTSKVRTPAGVHHAVYLMAKKTNQKQITVTIGANLDDAMVQNQVQAAFDAQKLLDSERAGCKVIVVHDGQSYENKQQWDERRKQAQTSIRAGNSDGGPTILEQYGDATGDDDMYGGDTTHSDGNGREVDPYTLGHSDASGDVGVYGRGEYMYGTGGAAYTSANSDAEGDVGVYGGGGSDNEGMDFEAIARRSPTLINVNSDNEGGDDDYEDGVSSSAQGAGGYNSSSSDSNDSAYEVADSIAGAVNGGADRSEDAYAGSAGAYDRLQRGGRRRT